MTTSVGDGEEQLDESSPNADASQTLDSDDGDVDEIPAIANSLGQDELEEANGERESEDQELNSSNFY